MIIGTALSCRQFGKVADNARSQSTGCDISVLDATPIRLANPSRTLSVYPQGLATSNGDIIALGSHAHFWPTGKAQGTASPRDPLGFVLYASGRIKEVPQPLDSVAARYPRVANAGVDRWHVLFVTQAGDSKIDVAGADKGELWYGMLEGARWTRIERVAAVQNAYLEAELSSDLVSHDGTLSFAFGFGDRSSAAGRRPNGHGVVLIQHRGSSWKFDTLKSEFAPNYVRLAWDSTSGVLAAAIIRGYVEEGRGRASSVFITTYDTAWQSPVRVGGNGIRPTLAPELVAVKGGAVATWINEARTTSDAPYIEAAWVTFRNRSVVPNVKPETVSVGSASAFYDVIALDSGRLLWVLRVPSSQTRARIILGIAGETLLDTAVLTLPMATPRARIVRLSKSTVGVVSSRIDTAGSNTVATTLVTRLDVRCREGRAEQ